MTRYSVYTSDMWDFCPPHPGTCNSIFFFEKAARASRGHLVQILKSQHDSDCIHGDFGSATSAVGCSCSCSVLRVVKLAFVLTLDHVY